MRTSLLTAFVLAFAAAARADEPDAKDVTLRVEYALKSPRTRDPVLGGSKDKVVFNVWIPANTKVVRGAICNPFSKDEPPSKHWQAACRHWQFAFVQVDFDAVKKDEFVLLKTALTDLAKTSKRAELEALPLCFLGMSRGGGMSMNLAELMPERTIAAAPVCLEVGPTSDATRRVPVLTIFGEKDGSQMKLLLDKLPAARKDDARFGIAVQWNRKHEFGQANNLAFAFFDDVISRRVPKEPGPLLDTSLESGWLGDVSTWGKDGKLPTIAAWADYKGDRAAACWLPSERVAATWRAFVGASRDVTLTAPAGLGDGQQFGAHSASKPVAVSVAVANLKPAKVELWDAHEKLAEKAEAPWAFEVPLKPGVHALYAVTKGDGTDPRSSRPHTIVVGE